MADRRVLLIDDNQTFLTHARRFLEYQPGLQVVGAYSSPLKALTDMVRLKPDVCLLDISMPECNGLRLISKIRRHVPSARIVMLSSHDDESYRAASLEIGAHAFVSKTAMDEDLLQAISSVLPSRRI